MTKKLGRLFKQLWRGDLWKNSTCGKIWNMSEAPINKLAKLVERVRIFMAAEPGLLLTYVLSVVIEDLELLKRMLSCRMNCGPLSKKISIILVIETSESKRFWSSESSFSILFASLSKKLQYFLSFIRGNCQRNPYFPKSSSWNLPFFLK